MSLRKQLPIYCENCKQMGLATSPMKYMEGSQERYGEMWYQCTVCPHKSRAVQCPRCKCYYVNNADVQSIHQDGECMRCEHITGELRFESLPDDESEEE